LYSLRKISVSLLLFFLFTKASTAIPFRFAAGAREAGMGYTCVMNYGFWSSFHNQAGLALNKDLAAGINYENRFGIQELGTKTMALIIPAETGSLGLSYSNHGYRDLNLHMAGIASGIKLSDKIAGGVQIDFLSERTSGEYSNNSAITCEAGLLILPSADTRIGIHILNLVPNSIRRYFMPSEIRIGAGYNISPVIRIAVEVAKNSIYPVIFKTGFEYEPANKLFLRGGFCSNNTTLSLGIGYKTKLVTTDIAFATHERLGIISSISVIMNI
jgi:hypothetical protein